MSGATGQVHTGQDAIGVSSSSGWIPNFIYTVSCDVSHIFGNDLTVNATGDLATSDGTTLGEERVLRRLLTSTGNYIWWLDYGAGLARFIGRPAAPRRIAAITRSQMFREAAVAQKPLPTVTIATSPDGTFTLGIRYVDARTGGTAVLSVPVGD